MAGWKGLGTVSDAAVPEVIKQDTRAFIQTLPAIEKVDVEQDYNVTYWEDGTGQHAVILETSHDRESWHYALIYDRDSHRIKVLRYSTGSYMS